MILPDVNVLLATFRASHAHHLGASSAMLDVDQPVGIVDVVAASVMRMATNPRVFPDPDPAEDVASFLEALLEPPGTLLVGSPATWARFVDICRTQRLRGNDVPDAHLAAIAIENRATVLTLDRGLARYEGLRLQFVELA